MEMIKVSEIVKGETTHPNWSSGSVYPLESFDEGDKTVVKYVMNKTINNRSYSRKFPKEIKLTLKLCWVLGFLRGEGFNGLGKSTYHRFGVTNKNPKLVNFVLNELDFCGLLIKNNLPDNSIEIMHFSGKKEEVIKYWSSSLNVPVYKIKIKHYRHQFEKSKYGVCHVYLTDVLLRRIVDILHEKIIEKNSEGRI